MKRSLPGLNVQYPISQLIVAGKKIIETRTYPIPKSYLDREILLIETPGVEGAFKARIVGVIKFSGSFKYPSKTAFQADVKRHCVDKNSQWAWKDKPKWGWEIASVRPLTKTLPAPSRRGIVFTKQVPFKE